jgi:broad specificity phosphatase PhoE
MLFGIFMSLRVADLINDQLKEHKDELVLLVAHGGVMRHFKAALDKVSLEEPFQQYVENGEY